MFENLFYVLKRKFATAKLVPREKLKLGMVIYAVCLVGWVFFLTPFHNQAPPMEANVLRGNTLNFGPKLAEESTAAQLASQQKNLDTLKAMVHNYQMSGAPLTLSPRHQASFDKEMVKFNRDLRKKGLIFLMIIACMLVIGMATVVYDTYRACGYTTSWELALCVVHVLGLFAVIIIEKTFSFITALIDVLVKTVASVPGVALLVIGWNAISIGSGGFAFRWQEKPGFMESMVLEIIVGIFMVMGACLLREMLSAAAKYLKSEISQSSIQNER